MSILFCTPCYGGLVHAAHFRSCLALKEDLTKLGVTHDWLIGWNESLVHRARMEMLASFLKTEHTHLMTIDADIEFEPQHVANLWNMGVDIAVGCYRMKKPEERWFSAWKDSRLVNLDDCPKEPFEVDYAGTGFMLIKREVFEIVHAARKSKWMKANALVSGLIEDHEIEDEDAALLRGMLNHYAPTYHGQNGAVPALFMTPIHNGGLESEDYHFCRVAREGGFKVMMDPSVRLTHWGQYPFGK